MAVDIAFPGARVAVLVDGYLWHGCTDHFSTPHTHTDHWERKIAGNMARDQRTDEALANAGWDVLRFWANVAPEAIDRKTKTELVKRRRSVPAP